MKTFVTRRLVVRLFWALGALVLAFLLYAWRSPIPPIDEVIILHEALAHPLRPAKTIGVSLNTVEMSDAEARAEVQRVAELTGLPTTDPVRFDPAPLVEAVLAFDAGRRGVASGSSSV